MTPGSSHARDTVAETVAPHASAPDFSRSSFRLLIESSADGVLVVNLVGDVLYANPAAAEIFGKPLDVLLHVPLGRPVVSGDTAEITVHRQGGKPAQVEMRVVDIHWDGRQALLASLRDISVRRAEDERLRQSQKMEAVGRLAAGIVHDINNLLAVVTSGLRLLEKEIDRDPASPKINQLIEGMLERAQNGGALTQQLLAFSRRQPLSPEAVDLNQRISALTQMLERTLGRGVETRCVLDPALSPIHIDANQLDVAILNLAVNARDAMAGKGTLIIETSNATEDAETDSGSFVRVSIRDTGCGMSEDVLAQVFEPFFTTKGENEGTGLGLSQVYGFISQSGGHVRIDSAVGEGTAVHLLLPKKAKTEI